MAARYFDHDAWTGALINPAETDEGESVPEGLENRAHGIQPNQMSWL